MRSIWPAAVAILSSIEMSASWSRARTSLTCTSVLPTWPRRNALLSPSTQNWLAVSKYSSILREFSRAISSMFVSPSSSIWNIARYLTERSVCHFITGLFKPLRVMTTRDRHIQRVRNDSSDPAADSSRIFSNSPSLPSNLLISPNNSSLTPAQKTRDATVLTHPRARLRHNSLLVNTLELSHVSSRCRTRLQRSSMARSLA
ncbi:hypothetical protein EDB86DRAFT_2977193, partial [Lactarius hatsudake]